MGKRIIPLFLLPAGQALDEDAKNRFASVCAEDQGVALMPCLAADGGLEIDADPDAASRLETGLRAAGANKRVGLDPETSVSRGR